MAKRRVGRGMIHIKKTTLLFIGLFFLSLILIHFTFKKPLLYDLPYPHHLTTKPVACSNHPVSAPKVFYKQGDVMMDPYQPPLKDNKFYTKHVGIPINIPTQTVDANYGCMGVLTRLSGKEQILPLYGRPLNFGRGKFQYYAGSDKNNNIKLPISKSGRSCTGEYGCDELFNGDTVYVEGIKDTFKATIYENNVPRYIPFIC